MFAETLWEHVTNPEFRPFTIVLADGERIEVKHRDSVTIPSIMVNGKRFFSPRVTVLETSDNEVIERVISLPLIAQVINSYGLNGH